MRANITSNNNDNANARQRHRRDEMRQLVLGYVERCRGAAKLSPLRRAAALQWLFFDFRTVRLTHLCII